MFLFGHAGITAGIMLILFLILGKKKLIFTADFRLIILFSMIPDLIDKTVGHVMLAPVLNNGRIFGHTFLFLIVSTLVCIGLFKKYFWIYSIPIYAHHLLDTIFLTPKTFFWPLFGFGFESYDFNPFDHWYEIITTDPFTVIGEIVGLAICIWFFVFFKMYVKENFLLGLKHGRLRKRPIGPK